MKLLILAAMLSTALGVGDAMAQYPSGAEVARQAMIRAQAEKERNDRIVAEQRRREQERRDQERRVRELEQAQRRARTG